MENMKNCFFYKSSLKVKCLVFVLALILNSYIAGCSHRSVSQGEKSIVPDSVLVDVLYVTDRNVTGKETPGLYYGEERGTISYGMCQVSVRPDKAKSPFANHKLWKVNSQNAPSKKNELTDIRVMNKKAFIKKISTKATSSQNNTVLIYLHGYGRKFERAMRTTARIVYELSYQGTPILYSWPSKGKVSTYSADLANIDWSTPHLQSFLEDVMTMTGAGSIHILAHSLGNRALLEALVNLSKKTESDKLLRLGEIILAAPDVDRDIFIGDYAPILEQLASRVTLYVSSIDFPLIASGTINRSPRVGNKKRAVIFEGIQAIDATNAATLVTGHSYYRDSPEVLSDLYYLINKRMGAEIRPTLIPAGAPAGRYWKVISNKAVQ